MNAPGKRRSLLTLAFVALALLSITGAATASESAGLMSPAATPNALAESGRGFSYAFHYENITGAALRPRDSSSGWDYPGVGCVSLANGSELFNVHLGLPEGSRIDYLRIYYYDTSASNSTAWVTSYNSSGGVVDIVSVTSAGNAGYGTALSPYVGHVVDNGDNAYVLNWRASQTGSTMRLCGLRVAYRVPTQDLYLPLIFTG